MAKKVAPPKTVVTSDMIDKAARTSVVKDLVKLAEAFARAGVHGPFVVQLPLFTAVAVKGKGYRRHSVPVGTRVDAGKITIGKREGLIFSFPINGEWVCDKGPVEWIELSWDDVINSFAELADKVEERLVQAGAERLKVAEIHEAVKAAIVANPAMHKVLSEGFTLAQTHKKSEAADEVDQTNPAWGIF